MRLWRTTALLVLLIPTLAGCVGTLVKDLAKDQATLRLRINNALYGTLEIDRSNVQGGVATLTKDGMIVDTSGKVPSIEPRPGGVTVRPGLLLEPAAPSR